MSKARGGRIVTVFGSGSCAELGSLFFRRDPFALLLYELKQVQATHALILQCACNRRISFFILADVLCSVCCDQPRGWHGFKAAVVTTDAPAAAVAATCCLQLESFVGRGGAAYAEQVGLLASLQAGIYGILSPPISDASTGGA